MRIRFTNENQNTWNSNKLQHLLRQMVLTKYMNLYHHSSYSKTGYSFASFITRFQQSSAYPSESLEDFIKREVRSRLHSIKTYFEWTMENCNPKWHKSFEAWLMRVFLNNPSMIEDIAAPNNSVSEALEDFIELYPQLSPMERDIFNYEDHRQLQRTLQKYKEQGQSALQDPKSIPDTKLIGEDDDVIVLSPLTMQASCQLGLNTKWCTAKRNPRLNRFDAYTKGSTSEDFLTIPAGPLFVFIDKHSGQKYQYHQQSEQFMDEHDSPPNRKTTQFYIQKLMKFQPQLFNN